MLMATRTLKTKDGKIIGVLRGGVLYKRVEKSKHLFRKIGGNGSWGIDYDVLFNQLPERSSVYITETEEGILYMATKGHWKEYGQILHFKQDEEDHYTQVFLPLEYFTKVKQRP